MGHRPPATSYREVYQQDKSTPRRVRQLTSIVVKPLKAVKRSCICVILPESLAISIGIMKNQSSWQLSGISTLTFDATTCSQQYQADSHWGDDTFCQT